jgi:hypothetical protein
MRTHSSIPVRSQRLAGVPRRAAHPSTLPMLAFGAARRPRSGLGVIGRAARSHDSVDTSPFGERWLTKCEIAAYLRVTERFIELQQQVGLPVFRMGAVNRYRVSEVEAWSRAEYARSGLTGDGHGI